MMLPIVFFMVAIFAPSARCHAAGLLPDKACSPGIASEPRLGVVCGQSTRIRRHVRHSIRFAVFDEYGVSVARSAEFEVDHVIPIELGGSNAIENLWLQPIADAKRKDIAENLTHALVCSGAMQLREAQRRFADDWTRVLEAR